MLVKSLWIKASAKYINAHTNKLHQVSWQAKPKAEKCLSWSGCGTLDTRSQSAELSMKC